MIIQRIFLYSVAITLLASCVTKSEETVNEQNITYDNGQTLSVRKFNIQRHSKGLVTGIDYGTSFSYRYELSLSPGKVDWTGLSSEPKHIVMCPASIALHFVSIDYVKDESDEYIDKQVSEYVWFDDQRYFFKLLGDVYWKTLQPEEYKVKAKQCDEYEVPNESILDDNAPDREVSNHINPRPVSQNITSHSAQAVNLDEGNN